ncbi:hypothetical protein KI387_015512, partial [Taxus chinensis]
SRTRPARWSWRCGTFRPFWIIGPMLLALWCGNPLPPLLGVFVQEGIVAVAGRLTKLIVIALPGGSPSIGIALSTAVVGGPLTVLRSTVVGVPTTTPCLLCRGMGGILAKFPGWLLPFLLISRKTKMKKFLQAGRPFRMATIFL